jgi:O-succinylbenzoate synthase
VRIWASHYVLRARSSLGALASSRERHGAILKIENSEGLGYADLHPWVELGDLELREQLGYLADGMETALSRRSLTLADLDRESRNKNVSSFQGLQIPLSHFLINDVLTLRPEDLSIAWTGGFRSLKIKLGRDLQSELEALLEHAFGLSVFRLRFDFNASLVPKDFLAFVRALPEPVREAIEFVEDPTPWSNDKWAQLHLRTAVDLARDQSADLNAEISHGALQWVIIKPAVQEPLVVADWARALGASICVTSYLDHPVGQAGAALEAARLARNLKFTDCGLVSHFSYAANEFSELLNKSGPQFIAPEGTGIGFDELFEKQDWKLIR